MIGTVIREAFALYRPLSRMLITVTALIFLPFAAALLVLELLVPNTTSTQQSLLIINGVGTVLLFGPLASIVAVRSAMTIEGDQPALATNALKEAFALLPAYVITQVLTLVVIALLPAVLIAAGYIGNSPLMLTIGLGALFASVFINGVRLALTTVLVVVDDARYAPALRRSAQLTRGRFWGTLGTIIVLSLITLAVAMIISAGGLIAPDGASQAIANAITGVIGSALTAPFIALGIYRLYRNLAIAQKS